MLLASVAASTACADGAVGGGTAFIIIAQVAHRDPSASTVYLYLRRHSPEMG